METMLCDLNRITVDDRLQFRVETDMNMVDEYANAIADGDQFPPAVVFFDGTTRWLAAGFTRYAAHKLAGKKAIKIELRKGSWDDAFLFAGSSNLSNGVRPTNKDKHHAIMKYLGHPKFGKPSAEGGLSDRQIATYTGTSHALVGQLRNPTSTEKKAAKSAGEPATPRDKPTSKPGIQIVDPGPTGNITTSLQSVTGNSTSEADLGGDPAVVILREENDRLNDRLVAIAAGDSMTAEERAQILEDRELERRSFRALEAERDSIAKQRDFSMRECNELKSEVKRLRKRLDQALAKVSA